MEICLASGPGCGHTLCSFLDEAGLSPVTIGHKLAAVSFAFEMAACADPS